jgi:predicted phage-related endonuclease
MIAITSDNDFIAEYYSKTSENKTTQATKVYADYARNVLSLTAEKPKINQNEDNNQCPLSGTFSETKSIENDLANLVQQTHMHKCNNFCMRYRKRYVSYLN